MAQHEVTRLAVGVALQQIAKNVERHKTNWEAGYWLQKIADLIDRAEFKKAAEVMEENRSVLWGGERCIYLRGVFFDFICTYNGPAIPHIKRFYTDLENKLAEENR